MGPRRSVRPPLPTRAPRVPNGARHAGRALMHEPLQQSNKEGILQLNAGRNGGTPFSSTLPSAHKVGPALVSFVNELARQGWLAVIGEANALGNAGGLMH